MLRWLMIKLGFWIPVSVTQEDIDTGIMGDMCHCPVAKAVRRATGKDAHVDAFDCWVGKDMYVMPPSAEWFVKNYDRGLKGLMPFEFILK